MVDQQVLGGADQHDELDAFGRVIERTIDSTSESFTYQGTSEALVQSKVAGTATTFAQGPSGPIGYALDNDTHLYIKDLHSDVVAETPASGGGVDIRGASWYSPWGERESLDGSLGLLGFQGQPHTQLGEGPELVDMATRYYQAGLGRFTTGDVLFGEVSDPMSLNRFAYAGGSPVTNWDPSGMVFDPLTGGGRTPPEDETEPYGEPDVAATHVLALSPGPRCYSDEAILAAPTRRAVQSLGFPPDLSRKGAIEWMNAVLDVIGALPVRGGGQNYPGTDGFETVHPGEPDGVLGAILAFKGRGMGYTVNASGWLSTPDQTDVGLHRVTIWVRTNTGQEVVLGTVERDKESYDDDPNRIQFGIEGPVGAWQGRPIEVFGVGTYSYAGPNGTIVEDGVFSKVDFTVAFFYPTNESVGPA